MEKVTNFRPASWHARTDANVNATTQLSPFDYVDSIVSNTTSHPAPSTKRIYRSHVDYGSVLFLSTPLNISHCLLDACQLLMYVPNDMQIASGNSGSLHCFVGTESYIFGETYIG